MWVSYVTDELHTRECCKKLEVVKGKGLEDWLPEIKIEKLNFTSLLEGQFYYFGVERIGLTRFDKQDLRYLNKYLLQHLKKRKVFKT